MQLRTRLSTAVDNLISVCFSITCRDLQRSRSTNYRAMIRGNDLRLSINFKNLKPSDEKLTTLHPIAARQQKNLTEGQVIFLFKSLFKKNFCEIIFLIVLAILTC
jgi:hypothetical protein